MTLLHGDCLVMMRELQDASVDAVVTDPPYGLSFMGKRWDYEVPSVEIWRECLRVLKPGGHLLAFAGTRTQHRMACNIEDAGFDIRDMIAWISNKTFPKSLNVSKAIAKAAGADAAKQWAGWGTALKPVMEPITVARKPLVGTVAENVLTHGTGAINVDGCRVALQEGETTFGSGRSQSSAPATAFGDMGQRRIGVPNIHSTQGRHPANIIHDGSEQVMSLFPDNIKGGTWNRTAGARHFNNNGNPTEYQTGGKDSSTGSAARFFYCAKASKRDRDEGNHHPTVKPTDLMRYLCRLVTPLGGIVLDPFMGSGSTGKAAILEGFRFIGIEREAEYVEIAKKRIAACQTMPCDCTE